MLPDATVSDIAERMRRAVKVREEARQSLGEQQQSYEATLPAMPATIQTSLGWTISSRELALRLDAAPYAPTVRAVQKALKAKGGAQRPQHGRDRLLDELLEPVQGAEGGAGMDGADAAWMAGTRPSPKFWAKIGIFSGPTGRRLLTRSSSE